MRPKQWFTGASGKIALISIGVVVGLGLLVGALAWVASDFAASPPAGRASTMRPPAASISPPPPSASASPQAQASSAAAVAPPPQRAPARVPRSDPPAPQMAPPPPPAPSAALPPGLVVPSPIGKAYELKCTRPGSATYGTVHSLECTLDGWVNLPTQVPIYFGSGIGLPGSCINTEALTAVPPAIDRAPLQPPTPFRVLLDTTRAGCGGCTGRVSFSSGASPPFTPPPAGDFIFTIIIEGAPTPHPPNCGA